MKPQNLPKSLFLINPVLDTRGFIVGTTHPLPPTLLFKRLLTSPKKWISIKTGVDKKRGDSVKQGGA